MESETVWAGATKSKIAEGVHHFPALCVNTKIKCRKSGTHQINKLNSTTQVKQDNRTYMIRETHTIVGGFRVGGVQKSFLREKKICN